MRKDPSHVKWHIVVHPDWTDRIDWFRRANLPLSLHGYREDRMALGGADEPDISQFVYRLVSKCR
jgi:hypothetical protein